MSFASYSLVLFVILVKSSVLCEQSPQGQSHTGRKTVGCCWPDTFEATLGAAAGMPIDRTYDVNFVSTFIKPILIKR